MTNQRNSAQTVSAPLNMANDYTIKCDDCRVSHITKDSLKATQLFFYEHDFCSRRIYCGACGGREIDSSEFIDHAHHKHWDNVVTVQNNTHWLS